jgi:GNAT superfamily N-acetyltransferase
LTQTKLAGMDGEAINVRAAVPGDAEALELVHADVARYYAQAAPHYFKVAVLSGGGTDHTDVSSEEDAKLRLVAERDGEIVGALAARLIAPVQRGRHAAEGELGEIRLRIDYLATAAGRRRTGIGTRLVRAAEAWGRESGATIAETITSQDSPLSVPFWEDRMGYEETPTSLERRL